MSLPYDPETSQTTYMSLDSPLPYLEFPESSPISICSFGALRISELKYRINQSCDRFCFFLLNDDDEECMKENAEDTESNRGNSFELESLSNSTERSDISDWGSSFDAEENDFENYSSRLSASIPYAVDHTLCKETVQVQRVTIDMLVESLKVANLEISTYRKRIEEQYREEIISRAIFVLQRKIQKELDDLRDGYLEFLPN